MRVLKITLIGLIALSSSLISKESQIKLEDLPISPQIKSEAQDKVLAYHNTKLITHDGKQYVEELIRTVDGDQIHRVTPLAEWLVNHG